MGGIASCGSVWVKPDALVRGMTITRPAVTRRFSRIVTAAMKAAGSLGCDPPHTSSVPPGTPLSNTNTSVSPAVPPSGGWKSLSRRDSVRKGEG